MIDRQAQGQRQTIQELANCKDFFKEHRYLHSIDFMEDWDYEIELDYDRKWPIERDVS